MTKQLAWQEGSTVLRTFDPATTRVSDLAREVSRRMEAHLAGMRVVLSRVAEQAMVLEGHTIVLPQHSLEAEEAMAAELVACTLGARSRPELLPRDPFAGVRGDGIEPPTSRL